MLKAVKDEAEVQNEEWSYECSLFAHPNTWRNNPDLKSAPMKKVASIPPMNNSVSRTYKLQDSFS